MTAGLPGVQLYFRGDNLVKTEKDLQEIEKEWVALILEAKNLGIGKETIRNFINQPNNKDFLTRSEKYTN